MSKKVKMRHPKSGGERYFYEVSVPHHVRAGWELVKEKEDKPEPKAEVKAQPVNKAVAKKEGGAS